MDFFISRVFQKLVLHVYHCHVDAPIISLLFSCYKQTARDVHVGGKLICSVAKANQAMHFSLRGFRHRHFQDAVRALCRFVPYQGFRTSFKGLHQQHRACCCQNRFFHMLRFQDLHSVICVGLGFIRGSWNLSQNHDFYGETPKQCGEPEANAIAILS